MEEKIYIITQGEYSDYSIKACFSTREKAEEYLKIVEKTVKDWEDWYRIEEYPLDTGSEIVNFIMMRMELKVGFNTDSLKSGKIHINIQNKLRSDIEEEMYVTNNYYGTHSYSKSLNVYRIANPNKTIEEEIERVKKVAYDTLKRINYLILVEKVNLDDINEYLGGM